ISGSPFAPVAAGLPVGTARHYTRSIPGREYNADGTPETRRYRVRLLAEDGVERGVMETGPVDTSYDECAPPPPPPQVGNAQAARVANGDCVDEEPMRVRVQYSTSGTDVGDSVRVDVSVNGGGYTQIAARPAPLPPGPLSVPDLALWLRADDGLYQDAAKTTPATAEGHPVGAWEDRSGHGRDVTQATAA